MQSYHVLLQDPTTYIIFLCLVSWNLNGPCPSILNNPVLKICWGFFLCRSALRENVSNVDMRQRICKSIILKTYCYATQSPKNPPTSLVGTANNIIMPPPPPALLYRFTKYSESFWKFLWVDLNYGKCQNVNIIIFCLFTFCLLFIWLICEVSYIWLSMILSSTLTTGG